MARNYEKAIFFFHSIVIEAKRMQAKTIRFCANKISESHKMVWTICNFIPLHRIVFPFPSLTLSSLFVVGEQVDRHSHCIPFDLCFLFSPRDDNLFASVCGRISRFVSCVAHFEVSLIDIHSLYGALCTKIHINIIVMQCKLSLIVFKCEREWERAIRESFNDFQPTTTFLSFHPFSSRSNRSDKRFSFTCKQKISVYAMCDKSMSLLPTH